MTTTSSDLFLLQTGNIYAIPVLHYSMEMAAYVRLAFRHLAPDCVAVELAETMQNELMHAASRLPDISVVVAENENSPPLYYLCEPCDPAFEGLRSALEAHVSAFCIDLDVENYPHNQDFLPDPYATMRIGLKKYYEAYEKIALPQLKKTHHDIQRELYMARRLKELSLQYDKVLFVGGMSHVRDVLSLTSLNSFPKLTHATRQSVQVCTLSDRSCRDVLAEYGWASIHYEICRQYDHLPFPPDRQRLIYRLYKEAAKEYTSNSGNRVEGYHLRNAMKFAHNYALIKGQLVPDLFQILTAAKGCVDHNFAYEVWQIATSYPYLRNVDNLPALDLSIQDIWGKARHIRFQLKQKGTKGLNFHERSKNKKSLRFLPPGPFSICSYPPEDLHIERFGAFLRKKGTTMASEEKSRFSPSRLV